MSTGQLYDNIKSTSNPLDDNNNGGEMNVQNRGPSGSGHGWSGTPKYSSEVRVCILL